MNVTILDVYASARAAGLRYVTVSAPGIRRRRAGKGWIYFKPDGTRVQDAEELQRIRSLVIPPAWEQVWIATMGNAHLQAVGYDARGRRQYRYHPAYREVRDATKYSRMAAFAGQLPTIRAQVEEDLRLRELPKRKVVAAVVKLLESTSARVGNEEYAKQNDSFGLTTLRDHHVEIEGQKLRFHFRGKSGLDHEIELTDKRLAKIVGQCQDLAGQELFQYVGEDGEPCTIGSGDVNEYLREVSGEDFTAKDFRTWNGTREAVRALEEIGRAGTETEAKKNLVSAVKEVAAALRNRPATCRKYYIHPAIFEAYASGRMFEVLAEAGSGKGLSREENAVLGMIEGYAAVKVKGRGMRRAA